MHIKNGWNIQTQQCFWHIFKNVRGGSKEAQNTESQLKWLNIGPTLEQKQ